MEEHFVFIKLDKEGIDALCQHTWLERQAHFEELLDTLECDFKAVG